MKGKFATVIVKDFHGLCTLDISKSLKNLLYTIVCEDIKLALHHLFN